MEELQRLVAAAVAFESGVARHYGLEREDMRWFAALGAAEHGMTVTEIAATDDRSLTQVELALQRADELAQRYRVTSVPMFVVKRGVAVAVILNRHPEADPARWR